MAKLSSLKEEEGRPDWHEMVKNLAKGHEQVAKTAREVLRIAEEAGDDATADIVAPRVTLHEKTAWMLRATIIIHASVEAGLFVIFKRVSRQSNDRRFFEILVGF